MKTMKTFVGILLCLSFASLAHCTDGVAIGVDEEGITGEPVVKTSELEPEPLSGPCVDRADGAFCDDGNACTVDDRCESGGCVAGPAETCTTDNTCEVGHCDAEKGCIYEAVEDGIPCAVACFESATCQAGQCVVDASTERLCELTDAEKEQSPCVAERTCDPTTGACTMDVLKPVGVSCDADGNACTLEACTAEGKCESTGGMVTCEEEQAQLPCEKVVCNPLKGGCGSIGFVGEVSCDDMDACTMNDTCSLHAPGDSECKGLAIPIDDQNPCTLDACVDGKISHEPISGASCATGDACTPQGVCSDEGVCDYEVCNCAEDDC